VREIKKSSGQLKSLIALEEFHEEWQKNTKAKIIAGEHWGICCINEAEEIFLAMDIAYVFAFRGWSSNIPRQQFEQIMDQKEYNRCYLCGQGLASTILQDPRMEPIGEKVKPPVIIRSTDCAIGLRLSETWAKEYNAPFFPLQLCYFDGITKQPVPRRWEKLRDHWDEVIDARKIDLKVEELKELIKFLEITTGKTFSMNKLMKIMELVNEQNDYFRKARDLIAETSPCPVTVLDQQAIYHRLQERRGTAQVRDIAKMFYEDVKDRVEKSEAPCPNEKVRMMWLGGGSKDLYKYFEEKYGATVVCSSHLSAGADCYYRRIINNDPLRALASRYVYLGVFHGLGGPDWMFNEAKRHKVNGVVQISNIGKNCPHNILDQLTAISYEQLGLPTCTIYAGSVENAERNDAKIKIQISQFIENRLLP